ncbi:MAG: rhodanese-like domain-containing protein [Desulforegulaceae bacterium]|nr:rhodanese-like domain-containing protein [Desulforegulaceae bacterium]
MAPKTISDIQSDELRKFIAEKKEKDFALVDVREDFEYNESHIPGAAWIKLSELEKNPSLVPQSKEVVFYCRSGARSFAAARIFLDSENSKETQVVYNLKSGILGWDGVQLEEIPKFDVFKGKTKIEDLLIRAMELEKGAFNLYNSISEKYKNLPYIDLINRLKKAEIAHGKILFKRLGKPMEEFDSYFASLKGDLMESGISTDQALKKIESVETNLCIGLLEFLVLMEVMAYDLYKVMAEKEKSAKETFLLIAQEEKSHIRTIASAFALCG